MSKKEGTNGVKAAGKDTDAEGTKIIEKTNENNKALKEANNLLTKELKMYKERLTILGKKRVTVLKMDYDELQTQLLDEKLKNDDLEKQKMNVKHHEDKYLNEILELQNKNKDLENIICKMGKSTETLWLLTNEQTAYRDNIRSLGLGYKGPYVLSQDNAKNPKLYDAYELHDENVQLHVFDSEETLEDAEKSRLKMKDDFDKTLKQNELLKDRLLEVTLAEDVKNLVITSCVEIGNKNLQDEIERFSKESKDVSNESKTTDTFCNDAFDVTEEKSKRIVDLEKDLSKLEAKIQRSRVETNQCDKVKVKFDFAEIETKNIELEHQVASLLKENKHLEFVYKNLFDSIKKSRPSTQNLNIPQNEAEKLKSDVSEVVDKKFEHILGKDDSTPCSITESNISELEKESGENIYENAKCVLQTKIVKLEKVLTQQTKDFDDAKLELTQLENLKGKSMKTKFDKPSILGKPRADKLLINSQISESWFTPKVVVQKDLSKPVTAQSLPKNEKDQVLKRIASLESKLASQDLRSCQKEYHELRTSYNALKVKFYSLNRTKRKTNVLKSLKPKVSVSEKDHAGESSIPFSKRVSQFTTYSLQKDRKFSKKSQTFETSTPQKGFKTSASNAKNQSFETSHSCLHRLVPSCFVIYDLELLSLSSDFVFSSEIFESLSFRLDLLCHLAILCLDQHAHTLHHLESLLTISPSQTYIFEEDHFEHEHVVNESDYQLNKGSTISIFM
ncbi:hypothetical protein Tco_1227255 [Tanacetum coccineum]